jgi:hypothetical protein
METNGSSTARSKSVAEEVSLAMLSEANHVCRLHMLAEILCIPRQMKAAVNNCTVPNSEPRNKANDITAA